MLGVLAAIAIFVVAMSNSAQPEKPRRGPSNTQLDAISDAVTAATSAVTSAATSSVDYYTDALDSSATALMVTMSSSADESVSKAVNTLAIIGDTNVSSLTMSEAEATLNTLDIPSKLCPSSDVCLDVDQFYQTDTGLQLTTELEVTGIASVNTTVTFAGDSSATLSGYLSDMSTTVLGQTVSLTNIDVEGEISAGSLKKVSLSGDISLDALSFSAEVSYPPLDVCANMTSTLDLGTLFKIAGISDSFIPSVVMSDLDGMSFSSAQFCGVGGSLSTIGGAVDIFSFVGVKIDGDLDGSDMASAVSLPDFKFQKVSVIKDMGIATVLDSVFAVLSDSRLEFGNVDASLPATGMTNSLSGAQLDLYNTISVGSGLKFTFDLTSNSLFSVVSEWSGISLCSISAPFISTTDFGVNAQFAGSLELTSWLTVGDTSTGELFGMSVAVANGIESISLNGMVTLDLGGALQVLELSAIISDTSVAMSLTLADDWVSAFGITGLTILPTSVEIGFTGAEPSTFNLVSGLQVGSFSGSVAVLIPDIDVGEVCKSCLLPIL